MIQHLHWQRRNKDGIEGQHIAIVGYSHYCDKKSDDHNGFTRNVVKSVLNGAQRGDSFFSSVPKYFGFSDRADFWERVHFFNFVPSAFERSDMFASASSEQIDMARKRFLRILDKTGVDKALVFSRKAWDARPSLIEDEIGGCSSLRANPSDTWGTYIFEGRRVQVCGLKHPLRAKTAAMRESVMEFLNIHS